jgi:hypothetical protein
MTLCLISPTGTIYTTTKGSPNPAGVVPGMAIALVPPVTPGSNWTEYELYLFGYSQEEQPLAGVVSEGDRCTGPPAAQAMEIATSMAAERSTS